jgi:hypothetical protein
MRGIVMPEIHRPSVVADKQVHIAILIEIANRGSSPTPIIVNACCYGDVGKRSIVFVVSKKIRLWRQEPADHTADIKQIGPLVIVIVKEYRTPCHGNIP